MNYERFLDSELNGLDINEKIRIVDEAIWGLEKQISGLKHDKNTNLTITGFGLILLGVFGYASLFGLYLFIPTAMLGFGAYFLVDTTNKINSKNVFLEVLLRKKLSLAHERLNEERNKKDDFWERGRKQEYQRQRSYENRNQEFFFNIHNSSDQRGTFKNCITVKDVKKVYKTKAKKHHPDVGGDAEIFKTLVIQYERALNIAQTA